MPSFQQPSYQFGKHLHRRNASALLDARPLGLSSFELKAFTLNLCRAVCDFHGKNKAETHGGLELASIVISSDDPTSCSISLNRILSCSKCYPNSATTPNPLVTATVPTAGSKPSPTAAGTFGSTTEASGYSPASAMFNSYSWDDVVTGNRLQCDGASGCCSCAASGVSNNSYLTRGCSTRTSSSVCGTDSQDTGTFFLSCSIGCGHGTSSGSGGSDMKCTEAPSGWCRAPEQLLGLPYGPPADMFAVRCILAELATGQPLFPSPSAAAQLRRMSRLLRPVGRCTSGQCDRSGTTATETQDLYDKLQTGAVSLATAATSTEAAAVGKEEAATAAGSSNTAVDALTVGEKWSDSGGGGGGDGGGCDGGISRDPVRRWLLRQLALGTDRESPVQIPAVTQDGTAAAAVEDEHFADLVEACLHLDPTRRPTAEQALQMPYFASYGVEVQDTAVVVRKSIVETHPGERPGSGPNVVAVKDGGLCVINSRVRGSSSSRPENGGEAVTLPTSLASTAKATGIPPPSPGSRGCVLSEVAEADRDLNTPPPPPAPAPAPAPPNAALYDTTRPQHRTSQQLQAGSPSSSASKYLLEPPSSTAAVAATAGSMAALMSRPPTATHGSVDSASASAGDSASSTPRSRIWTNRQTPESAPLPIVTFPTDESSVSTGAIAVPPLAETDPRVSDTAGELAHTSNAGVQAPPLFRTSFSGSPARGRTTEATSCTNISPLGLSRTSGCGGCGGGGRGDGGDDGGGATSRSPGAHLKPQRLPWTYRSRDGRGGESPLDLPLVLLQGDRSVVARYNLNPIHPKPRPQYSKKHGPMDRSLLPFLQQHEMGVQNDNEMAEDFEMLPQGGCGDQYDTATTAAISTATAVAPAAAAAAVSGIAIPYAPGGPRPVNSKGTVPPAPCFSSGTRAVGDAAAAPSGGGCGGCGGVAAAAAAAACRAASGAGEGIMSREDGWRLEGRVGLGFSGPSRSVNVTNAEQALPYWRHNRHSYNTIYPRVTSPSTLQPLVMHPAALVPSGSQKTSPWRSNSESQLVIVPSDPWVSGAAHGGAGGPGTAVSCLNRREYVSTGTSRPDTAGADGPEPGRLAVGVEAEPDAGAGFNDSGPIWPTGRARPHVMKWAGSVRVGSVGGGGGGDTYGGGGGGSDGPLPRLISVLQRELIAQHQYLPATFGGASGGGGGFLRSYTLTETDPLRTLSEVCESTCRKTCLPVILSVTQPDGAATTTAAISEIPLPYGAHSQRRSLAPPPVRGASAASELDGGGARTVASTPPPLTVKGIARRAKDRLQQYFSEDGGSGGGGGGGGSGATTGRRGAVGGSDEAARSLRPVISSVRVDDRGGSDVADVRTRGHGSGDGNVSGGNISGSGGGGGGKRLLMSTLSRALKLGASLGQRVVPEKRIVR